MANLTEEDVNALAKKYVQWHKMLQSLHYYPEVVLSDNYLMCCWSYIFVYFDIYFFRHNRESFIFNKYMKQYQLSDQCDKIFNI